MRRSVLIVPALALIVATSASAQQNDRMDRPPEASRGSELAFFSGASETVGRDTHLADVLCSRSRA